MASVKLRVLIICGAAALLSVVAACSSSSGGGREAPSHTAKGASSAATASAPSDGLIAQFTKGTGKAPSGVPVTVAAGKNIVIIPCSTALEGCMSGANAALAAVKVLGWHGKIIDGGYSAAGYAKAIHAAVADKADGIMLTAIDCPYAKSALEDAKAADIPVVTSFSYDCNDPAFGGGGAALYSGITANWDTYLQSWGAAKAQLVAAKKPGAEIIKITLSEFTGSIYENKGFDEGIKQACGSCKVDTIALTNADLAGSGATQKIQAAVVSHPSASVIVAPAEPITGFIVSTLKQDPGRKFFVLGGQGEASTMADIRAGTVSADLCLDPTWLGWAEADVLVRVLAKQPIPSEGLGWQLVTKGVNLPASGPFVSSVNYVAAYKRMWGK